MGMLALCQLLRHDDYLGWHSVRTRLQHFMLLSLALHQLDRARPRRDEQNAEHGRMHHSDERCLRDFRNTSMGVDCELVIRPFDCQ